MSRKRRGRPPYKPLLTIAQILAWADRHYRQFGTWPYASAGRIVGARNESWAGVAYALSRGKRGLKKGTPLARLLRRERGVICRRAALTEATILQWAEAHRRRSGTWPSPYGGTIPDAPGETWPAINAALKMGVGGLSRGSSLDKLLAKHGIQRKRRFTPEQVLEWADAFFAVRRHWPYLNSGSVADAPGVTWRSVDRALREGTRGFKGNSSLSAFLNHHRGIFNGLKTRPHAACKKPLPSIS